MYLPVYLFAMTHLVMGNVTTGTPVLQTQHGAVVHWGKPILDVGFDPQKTSRWIPPLGVRQAIADAISTWNRIQAGQPQLYLVDQGPFDITLRFCRGHWTGNKVDLGHSEFTAEPKTGLLQSSVVEINECDRSFFAPGDHPKGRHALAAVLVHELGHILGLGHSKNSSSLMFPTGGGVTFREPHSEDTAAMASIYLGRFSELPPAMSPKPELARVPTTVAKQTHHAIPENATPLLSIKAHNGRELMVYTSEPTLLPPLGANQAERPRRAKRGKVKR